MRRLAVALVVSTIFVLLSGCGADDTASDSPRPDPASTAASEAGGSCTYTRTGDASRKADLPPSDPDPSKSVKVSTNRGAIRATLDATRTPCTANSFTSLARQGFFDNTKCHRLTTQSIFVLQCGDPSATGGGGPGYSFADELTGKETYPAGTLAMANAGPDTNGSQFFLVYADTALPPSYTVFGHMDAAGMDAVKKIAAEGQDGSISAGGGKPNNPALIVSVTVG
jgi:peptidyl-prolyl cis-trans isomerase B (cyclophilin B)